MTLIIILALVAAAGIVMTSMQVAVTWGLMRIPLNSVTPASEIPLQESHVPRVSILKPISGLEDGLEGNLISFASLCNISYEVIMSVADSDDPAIEVIERVCRRYPRAPFSLIIGGDASRAMMNPKIKRLLAAMPLARGEIIFISDSNIRVSPDFLVRTVKAFDDPSVGCVSNIFIAEGAASFGATIESLYLLTFVAAGNALADAGEVPCVVGKSMALTRSLLARIGGFEAFANRLAEDQAIGIAVAEAGYGLVLSPVVVRNVIEKRKLRAAIERQIRWSKIRYAFSKLTFTSEFLVNPFPFVILACIIAILVATDSIFSLSVFAALTLLIRITQARILVRLTGAKLSWKQTIMMPVQDLIQFGVTFIPYFSNEVNWRGHLARIGNGTVVNGQWSVARDRHPAVVSNQKSADEKLLITDH